MLPAFTMPADNLKQELVVSGKAVKSFIFYLISGKIDIKSKNCLCKNAIDFHISNIFHFEFSFTVLRLAPISKIIKWSNHMFDPLNKCFKII